MSAPSLHGTAAVLFSVGYTVRIGCHLYGIWRRKRKIKKTSLEEASAKAVTEDDYEDKIAEWKLEIRHKWLNSGFCLLTAFWWNFYTTIWCRLGYYVHVLIHGDPGKMIGEAPCSGDGLYGSSCIFLSPFLEPMFIYGIPYPGANRPCPTSLITTFFFLVGLGLFMYLQKKKTGSLSDHRFAALFFLGLILFFLFAPALFQYAIIVYALIAHSLTSG
ncbi:MAG: hypothetical protein EA357_07790 [Micavibrio sp.]|nr:MAG: hypothetical protein EA357_07790 [Micavibrio sp.]